MLFKHREPQSYTEKSYNIKSLWLSVPLRELYVPKYLQG